MCVCVRVSPFWVPLAAAASFPPAPVYLCVYLSLLKSLPAANFPGSPPAHQRARQRFARGLSPRQHVSARTQAVFHHRVAGGQRQPLARVSLRGSYPAGGAELCQFQPDEPFSQRLPLHRQGGLLQPGLGLCRGRLTSAEPGRAGPSRAPSPRPGRPPAARLALHAPALRLAAERPLHLLPLANTPLPVSGPEVPRYVQLFLSSLFPPAAGLPPSIPSPSPAPIHPPAPGSRRSPAGRARLRVCSRFGFPSSKIRERPAPASPGFSSPKEAGLEKPPGYFSSNLRSDPESREWCAGGAPARAGTEPKEGEGGKKIKIKAQRRREPRIWGCRESRD